MKRLRRCVLSLATFAALHAAAAGAGPSARPAAAAPQHWVVNADLQVRALLPDVWMHVSWQRLADGRRFPSNGLIVRDGDALLLVDTAWGEDSTAALMDWIDRELRLPVRAVIPTHFHADRVGGAGSLAARGVPLRPSPQTLALARAAGQPLTQVTSLPALAPGSALALGPLELFHPGHAHSADNLVVWLPRAGLLFGGCAVKSLDATALGNLADADPAQWPAAMQRLQGRYPQPRIVIPGHGAEGDAALLVHTARLAQRGR